MRRKLRGAENGGLRVGGCDEKEGGQKWTSEEVAVRNKAGAALLTNARPKLFRVKNQDIVHYRFVLLDGQTNRFLMWDLKIFTRSHRGGKESFQPVLSCLKETEENNFGTCTKEEDCNMRQVSNQDVGKAEVRTGETISVGVSPDPVMDTPML